MRCEHLRDQIGRYRDGELDHADAQAVTRHLAECAACRAEVRDLDRIGTALIDARFQLPADLDARLHQIVAADAKGERDGLAEREAGRGHAVARARPAFPMGWRQIAAVVLATAMLSSLATWLALTGFGHGQLATLTASSAATLRRDAVTAHIRSLLTETTIQVASSDTHTVKPWFAGRVEFAPSVRDLQADGFALLGGRLDFVGERRVGVTVYKRRLHTINVFMWASDAPAGSSGAVASSPPDIAAERGYNIVSWTRAGVTYWAVSDLNVGELLQFQGLL